MSKSQNQKVLIIIILIALLLMALVWCYFDERLLQIEKVGTERSFLKASRYVPFV